VTAIADVRGQALLKGGAEAQKLSSSSTEFDFRLSRWSSDRFIGVSLGMVLVISSLLTCMQVLAAATRAETTFLAQTVNRAHKADRLPKSPSSHRHRLLQPHEIIIPGSPAVDERLPVGCDAVVSPIVNNRLAHVARHCVS
jgi:hypothetical protein